MCIVIIHTIQFTNWKAFCRAVDLINDNEEYLKAPIRGFVGFILGNNPLNRDDLTLEELLCCVRHVRNVKIRDWGGFHKMVSEVKAEDNVFGSIRFQIPV